MNLNLLEVGVQGSNILAQPVCGLWDCWLFWGGVLASLCLCHGLLPTPPSLSVGLKGWSCFHAIVGLKAICKNLKFFGEHHYRCPDSIFCDWANKHRWAYCHSHSAVLVSSFKLLCKCKNAVFGFGDSPHRAAWCTSGCCCQAQYVFRIDNGYSLIIAL